MTVESTHPQMTAVILEHSLLETLRQGKIAALSGNGKGGEGDDA